MRSTDEVASGLVSASVGRWDARGPLLVFASCKNERYCAPRSRHPWLRSSSQFPGHPIARRTHHVFGTRLRIGRFCVWDGFVLSVSRTRDFSEVLAEVRPEAERLISLYPQSRSALLPILHAFQNVEGWVSPEAMGAAAGWLGLPLSTVESTASFYTLFFGGRWGSICFRFAGICLVPSMELPR